MNFTKLRHVVQIDRAGSVTGAARVLNVTQSSVTKSLADIEQEVGHELFHRRARGMSATEQGRLFLDRAARILADIDQLIEDTRTRRDHREAVLRIGIAPSSLEGLLNRSVRSLIRRYPDYRVQLSAASVERAVQLLRQGDLDICVGPFDVFSSVQGFDTELLGELHARIFVRRTHPLMSLEAPTAEDIGAFPVIAPDLHGPYSERVLSLMADRPGPASRQIHILENFPMIADIVASTDAIGVVSTGYAGTRAFRDRFRTLPFDMGNPLPLGTAVRQGWHRTRAMDHFLAALRRHSPVEPDRRR